MSAQADIVVFDGAGTPVTHTFTADGVQGDATKKEWTAFWKELNASLPDNALNRITFRKRLQKNGYWRISVRADLPVMEAVAGQNSSGYTAPPKVALTESAEYVQYVHPRSTEAGRRLVRMMIVNMGNSVGTSVAAQQAGQIPFLTDKLVFPS